MPYAASRWRNRATPIEYQRPPRGASMSRRFNSAAMAACDSDPEAMTSAIVSRQVFGPLVSRRTDCCCGGRIAPPSPAEGGRTVRVAERAALPGESFTGHCEGFPRALGDHLPFTLGDHRHDAHDSFVSVWQVCRDEPHATVAEVQQERRVAGQPVELGDDQAGTADLGATDGTAKLGPVVALAAFYFRDFLQQPAAAAVYERLHSVALCFQAQA